MASRIEGKTKCALWSAGLLLVVALAAPSAAQALGFVSFGSGVPLAGPPAYSYPPPAYYAPPAYYYPPPAAAPASAAPPYQAGGEQAQGQTCREYQSTTKIDGRPQATYGTACLQPDGTWRIVN